MSFSSASSASSQLHAQRWYPSASTLGPVDGYRLSGHLLVPDHSSHVADHMQSTDPVRQFAAALNQIIGAVLGNENGIKDFEGIKDFAAQFGLKFDSTPSLPTRSVLTSMTTDMSVNQNEVKYLCDEKKDGKRVFSFRKRLSVEERKHLGDRGEIKLRLPDFLTSYDRRIVVQAITVEVRETIKANRVAGVSAPFVSKVLKRIHTDHLTTIRALRSEKSVKKLVQNSVGTNNLPRPILTMDIERLAQFVVQKNLSELQDRLFDAPVSDDELDTMLQTALNDRIRFQRALVQGNLDVVKPVIPTLEKAAGVSVSVSEEETVKKLLQQLLYSLRDGADKQVAILQGNETKKHEQPVNPIDEGPFVSDLMTDWAENPSSDASAKSHAEGHRAAELWDEYCIEKHGRRLALRDTTREEVRKFVGYLRGKIARNRTKPYSNASIKKYVGLISAAINYSIVELSKNYLNPFTHQTHRLKCKKTRLNFGTDQLQAIFASVEFQVLLRDTDGAGQGTALAALIALGTGARLGEIIQLQAQDIEFDGVHAYVKIRSAEFEDEDVEQDTKTGESRESLILPMVLDTPAGEFLRNAKKAGGAVFGHLKKYSRPSDRVSKKFARFLDDVGVTQKKFVFHSFRHTFIEGARCVTNPTPISKQVLCAQVGHEGDGGSEHDYGSGLFSRAVLTEQIRHITFKGFDLIEALRVGEAAYVASCSK